MAYIALADFRTASLAEYASGLALSTAEASDANLTAAIARLSARLDGITDDHFESETLTFDLDGSGTTRLFLPRRCTTVNSVALRSEALFTTQSTLTYYLHSSLYASGTKALGNYDWLETVPDSDGFTGLPSLWSGYLYSWPEVAQAVRVQGTFGWSATPGDIKRALALMVWDHFKPRSADLHRVTRLTTNTVSTEYAPPGEDEPTGIPEADEILRVYRRAPNAVYA